MFKLFREERVIYRLITLAVLAATVYFVCRIVYAGILALPFPKELLEPSNVALTETFLSGKSPYTAGALEWKTPGVNYDYPFMNSLLAAAIAKIFGCTAVTGHFIVSLTSILVSGIIGFKLVEKYAQTTITPILAGLLFMFCHWRFGYISAAPDDLGLLLLLITASTTVSTRIKNKPLWCAVGITLCFYTKQYFVLVAAGIFIYMLLYSRKEAVKFLIWTVVINVAAAALISLFWPLYWTKAFFFTYVGTAIGGGGKISTLIGQLKYLIVVFAALFLIVAVSAFTAIRKYYNNKEHISKIKIKENDAFALSAIQSVVMLAPLYVLGRNDGALLSYFLQLWIPFISIVALVSLERMKPEKHEYFYMVAYAAVAALTVYFGFGKLPLHILTENERSDWEKAYAYTEEYSKSGEIFYSRGLAYDGFARGNGDWMCGHEGEPDAETEYFLAEAGIPVDRFPYIHLIVRQNEVYRAGLTQKARDHKYSLITFEPYDRFIPFNERYCEELGYKCIDRLMLWFGNMQYEVVFYAPG